MNSRPNLPVEVVERIRAGRKIEAIKLLREKTGLGLKDAKLAVDAYIDADPELKKRTDEILAAARGQRIPRGLPGFRAPTFDWAAIKHLIGAMIAIALLGFMEAISIRFWWVWTATESSL